jgi:hypothetical protein
MGPGTPGGDDLASNTEANVIDSKTCRFGADQVEEEARDLSGAVVRHQAQKLLAQLIIYDAPDLVAGGIVCSDRGTAECIKKSAKKSDAALQAAECDGDRAAECRRAREDRRSDHRPVVSNESDGRNCVDRLVDRSESRPRSPREPRLPGRLLHCLKTVPRKSRRM